MIIKIGCIFWLHPLDKHALRQMEGYYIKRFPKKVQKESGTLHGLTLNHYWLDNHLVLWWDTKYSELHQLGKGIKNILFNNKITFNMENQCTVCWHCNVTIEKTKGMNRTLMIYSSEFWKRTKIFFPHVGHLKSL